jgi:hypothetical protein
MKFIKIFIKGEEITSTFMWIKNIFLKIFYKTSEFTFFYKDKRVNTNKASINKTVKKSLK